MYALAMRRPARPRRARDRRLRRRAPRQDRRESDGDTTVTQSQPERVLIARWLSGGESSSRNAMSSRRTPKRSRSRPRRAARSSASAGGARQSCQRSAQNGASSRTRGALLLSCTQASVAELSHQTLAPDEERASASKRRPLLLIAQRGIRAPARGCRSQAKPEAAGLRRLTPTSVRGGSKRWARTSR